MIGRILKALAFALLAILPGGRIASQKTPAPASAPRERKWKRWAFRGALVLGALGIGGFLAAASGIIPIKASSGHWAITRWFLNFSKERSVATHSIGIQSPDLDQPWRILKGAGHFELGCRPCHGSPGTPQPRVALAMTPNPPPLPSKISKWDPAELFYIVKHGIKFTGMPGWPAQKRDDEIWAVVAFLRKLPALDKASYERLVRGHADDTGLAPLEDLLPPVEIRGVITANCARCHGVHGLGRGNGAFPVLAGQKGEYLYASMKAYAQRRRHSGIMEPIAAAIDDKSLRQISEYYSKLQVPEVTATSDSGAVDRGRKIATYGVPSRRVAACSECHGPSPIKTNPLYPRLAGQYPEYVQLQLKLFKNRSRGGTEYSHIMHHTADGLTPEERKDVALYFASLKRKSNSDETE